MDEFQDPISFCIEFISLKSLISDTCEGIVRILEMNSGVGPGVRTGVRPGAGPGFGVGDFGGESPVPGGQSSFYESQSMTTFFVSQSVEDVLSPGISAIATVREILRVRYVTLYSLFV